MYENVVLIPAYNPTNFLIDYVESLKKNGFKNIIIVNDGSRSECDYIFQRIRKDDVCVLTHLVNKGKGKALKT